MKPNPMAIPTVDLSPFFAGAAGEEGRKKVKAIIKEACSEYGSFQITNHGIPLDLLTRSIELSRTFFALPDQEKLKNISGSAEPFPPGYSKSSKIEFFLMLHPRSISDVSNPRELGNVLEDMFEAFTKVGGVVEGIVNDCLGLPADFLKVYNDDRSSDVVAALSFSPATETDNEGVEEHTDPDCMTLVVQDEVGGLEVKKDGRWVPVVPHQGAIVVNLGDVIQVLSNNKFKSAIHRVVLAKERKRQSVAFSFNLGGEKWVAPLPQFTADIGEAAEYEGFVFKEYKEMKFSNA